jgi:hypothetical protein
MQHQACGIDKDMSLLALDLLPRIITVRIDAGPPFSALFTLWLSITAAVGLASRPACSRHFMYKAWWILCIHPRNAAWARRHAWARVR